MEPKPIYFEKESPDFNIGLYDKLERIAANRVVICLISEFGLCNNTRMQAHQVDAVIESLQTTTGIFKEHKTKIKPKDACANRDKTSKSIISPIKIIGPITLGGHTANDSPIESTS